MDDLTEHHKPTCHTCGGDRLARMCKKCYLDPMITVIRGLRRGSCWCEMGIGNPMVSQHTRTCLEASRLMDVFAAAERQGG